MFSLPFPNPFRCLHFPPGFFQLPLKPILSKFAHIFSELNQVFELSVQFWDSRCFAASD
jgi:hypothetical protein